jgi:FlaA1/EpsC-like NDP-sugar epimerase
MGEPITILELAKKMIRFSGFNLEGENNSGDVIEIIFTGLRPGEKLYEELFVDPIQQETSHPKIFRTTQEFLKIEDVNHFLKELEEAIETNEPNCVYEILTKAIPEYIPNN